MKKLSFFLFFIFALFGSILFAFASNIFEIRSISYDKLSFEIYSNIHSSNGDPFFSMTEINKKVDKIPRAMKPYLKMIINHAPRPKNGLKLKVFSKNYTIYFKKSTNCM